MVARGYICWVLKSTCTCFSGRFLEGTSSDTFKSTCKYTVRESRVEGVKWNLTCMGCRLDCLALLLGELFRMHAVVAKFGIYFYFLNLSC